MNFNIILPCKPISRKWSFLTALATKFLHDFVSYMPATMLCTKCNMGMNVFMYTLKNELNGVYRLHSISLD